MVRCPTASYRFLSTYTHCRGQGAGGANVLIAFNQVSYVCDSLSGHGALLWFVVHCQEYLSEISDGEGGADHPSGLTDFA